MEEISINIAGFFETVMMSKEDINKSIAHNLELDFKTASQQLKVDFDNLFEDKVEASASKMLIIIDEILQKLDDDKIQQIKYLEEFKKKVLKYITVPSQIAKEYPEHIFKNSEAFQFYMDALYNLNVIDKYNRVLDKLQVIAKTIFDNEDFKNNIFRYDLSQKGYVIFLNKRFNCNINPDNMSKSSIHLDRVAEYFNENFKSI